MNQLVAVLKHHHKELAQHIVGAIVIDEQHLMENQLLARARAFYATLSVRQSKP
jgi:hypothetical protein